MDPKSTGDPNKSHQGGRRGDQKKPSMLVDIVIVHSGIQSRKLTQLKQHSSSKCRQLLSIWTEVTKSIYLASSELIFSLHMSSAGSLVKSSAVSCAAASISGSTSSVTSSSSSSSSLLQVRLRISTSQSSPSPENRFIFGLKTVWLNYFSIFGHL